MGAFLDWMDRFASGLQAGGGRMAGVGNAWSGARQKAQEQQEKEVMKQAIKEIDDYDKAIQTVGGVNPQKAFSMAEAQRKFEQDYELNKMKLQKQAEALNSPKGEFAYLYNLYQDPSLSDEQRTMIKNRLDVLQQTPQLYGKKSYEQTIGKQQAEAGLPYGSSQIVTRADIERANKQAEEEAKQEANITEQQRTGQQFVDVAGSLLNELEKNKNLFTAYSPYSKKLGSLTSGSLGMTDEERKKRGEVVSLIKNLEQKLVANARASGQVGINTLAERQAALGPLNENGEAEELIGYVKGLIDINNEIYNLNANPTEQSEQEVDYKIYFGG